MNTLGMKPQTLDRILQNSNKSYLDTDLFIIIMLSGLFDTKSINSEVERPEPPTDDFMAKPTPLNESMYMIIEFD